VERTVSTITAATSSSLQNVLDVVGAARVARAAAAEMAVARIAGLHVLGAGQERPDAAAEQRLAADRDGVERGAVERVPHRDRLVPAGGEARELERHADRLGAHWSE
jgi:hypothetical protein